MVEILSKVGLASQAELFADTTLANPGWHKPSSNGQRQLISFPPIMLRFFHSCN
jgi:hypothetical protein